MVWLNRSPIPVGRRGGNFLVQMISTRLPSRRGRVGGRHPVVYNRYLHPSYARKIRYCPEDDPSSFSLCTWRSFCGFQSLSKMMTVSAVARLMPRPPARVDSRKQKSCEPGALKWSIAFLRSSPFIPPSSRWNGNRRSSAINSGKKSVKVKSDKFLDSEFVKRNKQRCCRTVILFFGSGSSFNF